SRNRSVSAARRRGKFSLKFASGRIAFKDDLEKRNWIFQKDDVFGKMLVRRLFHFKGVAVLCPR
ncbi:MAG: hypothetical protein WAK04_16625, partial [Xanthobacteraceae bacterium]